jgi:hypothetical protein
MTQPGEDLHELDIPLDAVRADLEAPDADVFEQSWPANPARAGGPTSVPLEANEADAAEQAMVVDLDDDDYR